MDSSNSKRRRGFRQFLSDKADRLLDRSPIQAGSQQPSRTPSIRSPSPTPHPLPVDQAGVSPGTDDISSVPTTLHVALTNVLSPATDVIPPVLVDLQGEPSITADLPTTTRATYAGGGRTDTTFVELQAATEMREQSESLEVPKSQSAAASSAIPTSQSGEVSRPVKAPVAIAKRVPNADLDVTPPPVVPSSVPTNISRGLPNPIEISLDTEPPNENKDQGGSFGSSNPVTSTNERTNSRVWRGLGTALRALHKSAKLFPPVQSSIRTFISCVNLMEGTSRDQGECEELASEITSMIELLVEHMESSTSARMSGSIANFARGIEEQAKLIKRNRDQGTARYLAGAYAAEEELASCYRRIASLFRQLQIDANLSVWDIVNDQMAHTRLGELAPAKLASYDSALSTSISRRTCTEGTRIAILSGLASWSHNPSSADIYWMNGMAGTGKTTIACTFSESLEERKQLAASFFCTRTVPECRMVTRIIPTIAFQLAQYSVPFQSVLCEILREDPSIGAKNIPKQFERLLRQPLLKVKEAIPTGLVVTIDALDECEDMREVELLLSVLCRSAGDIPLKFFVTSRPEPEIYDRMLARSQGYRTAMHLHEVEKSLVQADIELYLGAELDFVSPTPVQIKELARRSGALFIYAATLVRYIGTRKAKSNAQRRLWSVLSMISEPTKQYSEVDALYDAVLKAALDGEGLEAGEIENIRRVLRAVVCIQEPVSLEVLTALTGLNDEEQTSAAIEPLRAVLHLSETTGLVSTLHASFPDFLFDETRSGSFSCRLAAQSEILTRQCFKLMKSHLRFNICQLESSFASDSEVDDLVNRVEQYISPTLLYACQYWGDHLNNSIYIDSLSTMLDDFLSNQLLFWMEVLNLKGYIATGADVLLKAKQWLQTGCVDEDRARVAEDARNFVTSFAAHPVSQSTPHIYISALPFCPKSSSVFKHYWKNSKGLIVATGNAMDRRDMAALATWQTELEVLAIAYSPDGGRVAIGGPGGTIAIRDAYAGTLMVDPFKGHTDKVLSVAYSPDGSCIASGSDDKTIRMWNAHDGTPITGPFLGHSGSVWSLAYSPDCAHIVSGSYDKTIRVWSARDGMPVVGPFQGHSSFVWSVAYSPDGTRIVSGSSDKTIRIWDANSGTLMCDPLVGHTSLVRSVAYSPDGAHIVSGSFDNTIRIWDATSGRLITNPLKGHEGTILSVAYSPDGGRIVSGSNDNTIRVWDALDGKSVAGPFRGHTGLVRSVAFSPDGTRIISGSYDKTIRVWNAQSASLDTLPLEESTSSVASVTYSPDGTRIVSGDNDGVIRLWDAYTGTSVAELSKGHTGPLLSVAYSPDGTRITSGSEDGAIQVWDAHSGNTTATQTSRGHIGPVSSIAYSPDGIHIASCSEDGAIRVWDTRGDLHTSTPINWPLNMHASPVPSIAYSPDGTRIASGSENGTILVWDVYSNAPVTGPLGRYTGPALSIAYRPIGARIAIGSGNEAIRGWGAGSVRSIAYSPDGTRIASGSEDGAIRVWDANSGISVAEPFMGHTGPVLSIAYSPDGSRIASGSEDRTIRVWDAHSGTAITGPFKRQTGPVLSIAYSPDGTRIAAGSHDGAIQVWDASGATSIGGSIGRYLEQARPAGENGWVVSSSGRLLWWLPFDLRPWGDFSYRYRLFTINDCRDALNLDCENILIGERWIECYQPR